MSNIVETITGLTKTSGNMDKRIGAADMTNHALAVILASMTTTQKSDGLSIETKEYVTALLAFMADEIKKKHAEIQAEE